MAPTITVGELTSARAGDSWIWKQSWSEYPVSEGWSLSYAFAGAVTLLTASGEITNDGAGTHTVNIPASRTMGMTAGQYHWVATMTGSGTYLGRRDTVGTGVLTVTDDVSQAEEGDLASPDEKLLLAIDAVIYGRVTDDVQRVMIGARSVDKIPIQELFAIKSRIERRVQLRRRPGVVGGAAVVMFR